MIKMLALLISIITICCQQAWASEYTISVQITCNSQKTVLPEYLAATWEAETEHEGVKGVYRLTADGTAKLTRFIEEKLDPDQIDSITGWYLYGRAYPVYAQETDEKSPGPSRESSPRSFAEVQKLQELAAALAHNGKLINAVSLKLAEKSLTSEQRTSLKRQKQVLEKQRKSLLAQINSLNKSTTQSIEELVADTAALSDELASHFESAPTDEELSELAALDE